MANDEEAPAGKVHPQSQLNELSEAEWMYFTKSVLRTSYAEGVTAPAKCFLHKSSRMDI